MRLTLGVLSASDLEEGLDLLNLLRLLTRSKAGVSYTVSPLQKHGNGLSRAPVRAAPRREDLSPSLCRLIRRREERGRHHGDPHSPSPCLRLTSLLLPCSCPITPITRVGGRARRKFDPSVSAQKDELWWEFRRVGCSELKNPCKGVS